MLFFGKFHHNHNHVHIVYYYEVIIKKNWSEFFIYNLFDKNIKVLLECQETIINVCKIFDYKKEIETNGNLGIFANIINSTRKIT